MRVDLHNHTPRCNHAEGELSLFVQKAIEYGTHIFGFADHAPMRHDTEYRMGLDEVDDYEQEILELKNRYKNKIDIKLGYEVDYLPGFEEQRILDANVDYLIGSVHFLGTFGVDHPESIFEYKKRDINRIWEEYFGAIKNMALTKQYNIVGHLDLVKIFKYLPNEDISKAIEDALIAIKESNMAIEINTSGFRKPIGEQYPSNSILTLMKKMEIPITFGSDGHLPMQVGLNMDKAIALAKNIGYKECIYFDQREMIKTVL